MCDVVATQYVIHTIVLHKNILYIYILFSTEAESAQ